MKQLPLFEQPYQAPPLDCQVCGFNNMQTDCGKLGPYELMGFKDGHRRFGENENGGCREWRHWMAYLLEVEP